MPAPKDPQKLQDWKDKLSRIAKNRTYSSETRLKMSVAQKARCTLEECVRRSEAAKARGDGLWMIGHTHSEEVRLKISQSHKVRWGSVESKSDSRCHQGCYQHTIWRTAVFKRDDYTCQDCGERGGDLEAHHIFWWSKFPLFRFLVWNGKTLCVKCHKKFHSRMV